MIKKLSQKYIHFFILLFALYTSCEKDPIFGLEKGWLYEDSSNDNTSLNEEDGSDDDGDDDGGNDGGDDGGDDDWGDGGDDGGSDGGDDGGDDGEIIPSGSCNIPYQTTGTNFTYIDPSQSVYRFGDSYTVEVYSAIYSIGQVNSISLILNEEVVYNFGNWLVFSNNKKVVTLPSESSTIVPSNCYAIGIVNGDDQYISSPFTIY